MIRLYGFVPVYKKKLFYNQIQIVFTGIREGEKLYEELLIDNNAINTEVDGIFLSNEFIKDTNVFIKKIITFLDNNNGNLSENFILSLLKKSNINLKSENKK
jgi:FlaA1/EpsC-like NDP-sugar epimerase